jgi:outer membrane protein
LISLLLLLAVGARAETVDLKFEDLPRLVSERNENASGAGSLADSARARTGSLRRSFLPSVEAVGGAERFQTGRYPYRGEPYGALEGKLNVFRGGRDVLEERVRESRRLGAEAQARGTYAEELTRARKAFWELVSLREIAALLKEAVAENEKLLQAANRRIARGLAAETDRLEFQIYGSQLGEEVASLEHETVLVQMRLAALLGAPPGARYETPASVPHDHDDATLAAPFDANAHPEVAAARAGSESAAAQHGEVLRRWTPSVDLYGGYYLYTLRERDYLDRGARDDRVVGARLSLALFDGFRSRADARAFSLQAEGYEHQARQRARAMAAQVEVTKEDLKHEHELVHHSEERIAQGKRYLTLTLDEYGRGVKNSLDVLGAAQRFTGFAKQYAERRREYQSVRCDLLALLGK